MRSCSHLPRWPSHKWWGHVADQVEAELGPCESHSYDCRCNLPAELACAGEGVCTLQHEHRQLRRCCGPACRTLRLASCEVLLLGACDHGDSAGDGDGAGEGAGTVTDEGAGTVTDECAEVTTRLGIGRPSGSVPGLSLSIYLEAAAFELDRRLEVGAARAELSSTDPHAAYAAALVGDRACVPRASRRPLLSLMRRLLSDHASGLKYGTGVCVETLNGYGGAEQCDVCDATDCGDSHSGGAVAADGAYSTGGGGGNEGVRR